MRRYTYFEAGKWRIKVGNAEFAGPWVDKLSYYEELAPNLENTKDEAYNLGYQTCLHAKGLTWSEARELQAYRATGLTVERAAELGKADSEGRVLQYAPGDTVYDRFGRPWEIVIVSVITRAYHDGPRHVYHRYHCGHSGTDDYCVMDSDEILTREEAEKVLEAEDHE